MEPTRYVRLGAIALVVLLAAPALAQTDVYHAERRIVRSVATPGPVGPTPILSDQSAWHVVVPPEGVVEVRAEGSATSVFFLRANRTVTPFWIPGPAASLVLNQTGDWRVEVDPAAGAAIDIRIFFRGAVGGQGGGPMRFTIHDVQADRGCVAEGVCLP